MTGGLSERRVYTPIVERNRIRVATTFLGVLLFFPTIFLFSSTDRLSRTRSNSIFCCALPNSPTLQQIIRQPSRSSFIPLSSSQFPLRFPPHPIRRSCGTFFAGHVFSVRKFFSCNLPFLCGQEADRCIRCFI